MSPKDPIAQTKLLIQVDHREQLNYNNRAVPLYLRRGILSRFSNYAAEVHFHDDLEFVYLLQGSMTYVVNGERVPLKEKEAIFINSRVLHYGCSFERKECIFLVLVLHPALLCASSYFEKNYLLPAIEEGGTSYLVLRHPEDSKALSYLESMIPYMDKENLDYLFLLGQIFHLWDLLYPRLLQNTAGKKKEDPILSAFKNMVSFIKSSYSEDIRLQDIASAGGFGKTKATELFHRYLNTTPMNFLNQYRLLQAAERILQEETPITEIASDCGYCDMSYFAKQFRKRYQMSPSQYRKRKDKNL